MTQKIKELEEKHLLNDDGFEQTVNQLRQDQHDGNGPQRGGRGGGNFRGGGRGGFGDSRGRGRGGRGGAGRGGRGGRAGPY